MTYKNIKIDTPTIKQVQEFCSRMKFKFSPYDCFAHYKAQNWKTKKGTELVSVEAMCNAYNGSFVLKRRKDKTNIFPTLSYERSPYKEQLLDIRWRLFRDFAIVTKGGVCEKCGSKKNLVIHHPNYINGYNAWDYSVRDVVCLCEGCHQKIHNIK